jgi:FixJ family two-component response regulator
MSPTHWSAGWQLQETLHAANSDLPIIFVTAFDSEPARTQAIEAGATAFLYKPLDSETLLDAIQTAIET